MTGEKMVTYQDLMFLVMNGELTELEKMARHDKSVLAIKDKAGRTLLMESAIFSKADIAELLVKNGIDINAQDKQGWCALHFAVQSFNGKICKLFIDNGANLELQDSFGNTPLMRALLAPSQSDKGEILTLLLDAGANRNKQNKSGILPFSLAQKITNHDYKKYFS
jgi:uncharacterized protein